MTTWLIGTDGSDHAAAALQWAAREAPARGAALRVLSAWQYPYLGITPMGGATVALPYDDLIAGTRTLVAEAIAGAGLPADTQAAVVEGPPASALLEAATEADLLIVGSRGRGGFARLLLGSVSQQCATHATVPTIVVPAAGEDQPVRRVAVGVDGSPGSIAALHWARTFAPADGEVAAISAWTPPELGVDGLDFRVLQDMADRARVGFDEIVDGVEATTSGAPITRRFVQDDARGVLAAESAGVDLVVVGSRGHRGIAGALLGSVTTWLLHHTLCPVAVVPTPAA